MRIFQNQTFARFARKNHISDAALCQCVRELRSGLIHASLGGDVYKQRIARAGQGKSGGYRSIVFFRAGQRAFFIFGFAKSDKDNVTTDELAGFKEFAKEVLSYDDTHLKAALSAGAFQEILCDEPLQE